MTPLSIAVVWALVAGALVWRGERVCLAWIAAWTRVRALPESVPEVAIPDDLYAIAQQESEPFAQQEMLKLAREKYAELGGDWNRVRRAIGVGEMP